MLDRLPIFRHLKARPRLAAVTILGILLWFLLPRSELDMNRTLIAWDSAIGLYLVLVTIMMVQSNPDRIRNRAALEDEGGLAILALTTFTAVTSLVAIVAELVAAKAFTGPLRLEHIGLAALTVFLSWTFMQTMFALHYAHEYYSGETETGLKGLDFPDKPSEPDYWDFIYFSFIIGTAAQTADINIVSKVLRRIVALHCVVVFFFNATILALTVNISASLF